MERVLKPLEPSALRDGNVVADPTGALNLWDLPARRYAILVTGPAAQQLDACVDSIRARILGDLDTLAEEAATLGPPTPRIWSSELSFSEGELRWRVEVDRLAQRVRLIEVRKTAGRQRPSRPV